MASVINTNITSLNAQRNLSSSQASLTTSIQRLSSGLRINSAKDDAAGMAISTRMTSQINGLNQASRNANDGISLAQTAEGAIGQMSDNLQRMRELSVQSANGTLSTDDRKGVQSEIDQLKSEINRVANQTSFNGTKLLDGTSGGFSFQVGADANQTIAINSLTDTRSTALGTSTTASAAGTVKAYSPTTGTNMTTAAGADANKSLAIGGFSVNGVAVAGADMAVTSNAAVTDTEYKEYMSKTVEAINVKSSESGVTASLKIDSSGMQISLSGVKSAKSADGSIAVTGGTVAATATGIVGITGAAAISGKSETTTGFDKVDVTSVAGANKGIAMIDGAINALNTMRADLGAVQNRFTSTVTNLQTTSENLSASRSRIQDADFASETASMTRGQILQQAGTAMLAQANSLPNGVLSLLR